MFFACFLAADGQYLMDMMDTSTALGSGLFSIYKKFDRLRVGGYMQPQFQVASAKGAKSFEGGDFPPEVNNRFMLRRGRIRFDYVHFAEKKGPSVHFAFQFDGTERGVYIRDFWGRVFENKYKLFSFTTGMFARPFGFETNLSSSDRESPERGRMNQLLMKSERDLGIMLSFDAKDKPGPIRHLKIDAGFFNGQGLPATEDFDSHKDFITRVGMHGLPVLGNASLNVAASYFNGGLIQNTNYRYTSGEEGGQKVFLLDSSHANQGKILPRHYYGMDMQLKIKKAVGFAEIRAEVIVGTQTATVESSETPPHLLTGQQAYYIRKFSGVYFYFLYHIFSDKHQLGIKYDLYDPNTAVKSSEIKGGTNLGGADVKYGSLGMGYINYINENLKLVLWYTLVTNETTSLSGFTADLDDNVLTCRLQFRF